MEATQKKEILFDSPEACTYRTDIKGWVSSTGFFFGDNKDSENMARYDGSTHRICECGLRMEKWYTLCDKCRDKKSNEAWKLKPKQKWDGISAIYSNALNSYYFSGEWEDDLDEDHPTVESLDLEICKPVYADEIDPNEYYYDDLPEDIEVPQSIQDAFDVLNVELKKQRLQGTIISWQPAGIPAEV